MRIEIGAKRTGARLRRQGLRLLLLLGVLAPAGLHAQYGHPVSDTTRAPDRGDVMLQSTAGAAVGGFLGIIAAIHPGCGSFVQTGHCKVPTMAIGFGTGTLIGTLAGAIRSTRTGNCSWPERLVRGLGGTLVGFGASVPIVAATHGYLRIGLAPVVPLSGAAGATIVLGHCAG